MNVKYVVYLSPTLSYKMQGNTSSYQAVVRGQIANPRRKNMTAGPDFNNYTAGSCSVIPTLRGNEVNMDTIDPGNNESSVYGVFLNQDGMFTAITYTKSETFKTENDTRRWLERNSSE